MPLSANYASQTDDDDDDDAASSSMRAVMDDNDEGDEDDSMVMLLRRAQSARTPGERKEMEGEEEPWWDDGVASSSAEATASRSAGKPTTKQTGSRAVESPINGVIDGRTDEPVETTKTLVTRREAAQRRLRNLFDVPEDEKLEVDYMCALHHKILLQGKMYVFENYVCFYSNVFGYTKTRTIPFSEITLINRAKTARVFHNAIEITYRGRTDFFTSFIFPERSFRFLCNQWAQVSHYGKLFASNSVLRSHDDAVADENEKVVTPSPQSTIDNASAKSETSDAIEEENDDDEFEDEIGDFGNAPTARVPGKMPSLPSTLIKTYEGQINCSIEEFFSAAWSNKSRNILQPKLSSALEQTGCSITDWIRSKTRGGCAREMMFTVPVKQTFGPKSTHCHQTQYYSVYEDDTLVFSTSQVQTDIPYGDYFRVEARWILRSIGKRKCSLFVGTEVIFTKSTMMKGLIVNSVTDESKEIIAKMVKIITNYINPKKKVEDAAPLEIVDVNKLKIPESSRDIVRNMLAPLKSFVETSKTETVNEMRQMDKWQKLCFLCSRAAKVGLFFVGFLLAHALLSMLTQWAFGGLLSRLFGWYPMRAVDEVAYWQKRSKLLNSELVALERRLGRLTSEIETAKMAMEASRY